MNIQQYFEEKERKEEESSAHNRDEQKNPGQAATHDDSYVIPVIQEQAHIDTKEIESAKLKIHKKIVEVEKNVNIPLIQEGYDIERVPINQYVDAHPPVREEGDTVIVPVVREVLVVEKRLELVEELRIIKRQTTVNHQENFTLRKDEVSVERIPTEKR